MAGARLLFGTSARAAAAVVVVAALSTGSPGEIRSSSPERLRDCPAPSGLLGDLLTGSFEPAAPSPDALPAFVGIGRSLRIRVDGAGATLAAGSARLRLSFSPGGAAPRILPSVPLPGRSQHCLGKDRRRWRSGVPRFAEVRPSDAAPGVGTLFRFRGCDPEYEFTVAPGADAGAIEVAVEGAQDLRIDEKGDLLAGVGKGAFRQSRPRAFEDGPGGRREVSAAFVLRGGNRYGFSLGPRDGTRALRIDPVLTFSTPLGGSVNDSAAAAAFAPDGTLWIGGGSESGDFPGGGAPTPSYGDAVVVHFDPASRSVLSTTWLGGHYYEGVSALRVAPDGGVFAAGWTDSEDFPASGGPQTVFGGYQDAFLARLDPAGGALSWSTYLGGWDEEHARVALALTADGDPVVAGTTESTDFPLRAAARGTLGGGSDGFATRVRADGSEFVFSTYLGGSFDDLAGPLAIAPDGGIFVAGSTQSADFTGPRLFALSPGTGYEGYLAELDPDGGPLRHLVLLGRCVPSALAFEPAGTVLLAGNTEDPAFPLPSALHGPPGPSAADALLARFDRGLGQVLAGMLYGGAGDETPPVLASAADGTAWIAGITNSTDLPGAFPASALPFRTTTSTAFIAHLDLGGQGLLSATRVGTGYTEPRALSMAPDGAAWMVGGTSAPEFPLVDPIQGTPRGGWSDMFLARFVAGESTPPPVAPDGVGAWALSGNEVLVIWRDLSPDETGFAIFRSPDESNLGYFSEYDRVGTVPAGTTEFVDRTALPDRRYLYAVQALDAFGGASSSAAAEVRTPSTLIIEIRGGGVSQFTPQVQGTIRGRILPRDRTRERPLDLVKDGLRIECSYDEGFPGSGSGVPGEYPGWSTTRRGFLWRSNPYNWATTVRFDPRRGTFRIRNIRLGGDLADKGSCRLRFTSGEDSGETHVSLGRGNRITVDGQ